MAAVTRYVVLLNSKVYQIDNVTACSITSPSVTDGTYRDQPPVVVGGAALVSSIGSQVLTVAGGTTQTTSGSTADIVAPSSVVQDDTFAHVAPRDYIAKLALLIFTTSDGISTYDCFFKLSEVSGVFNAAPPQWPSS